MSLISAGSISLDSTFKEHFLNIKCKKIEQLCLAKNTWGCKGWKNILFHEKKIKNVCERPGKNKRVKSSKFPHLKKFQHNSAQRVSVLKSK